LCNLTECTLQDNLFLSSWRCHSAFATDYHSKHLVAVQIYVNLYVNIFLGHS
jgi:hypothetical protein